MKKKNKWSTFILLLIFFVGLSVMLYPSISSYWNSRTQSQAIVDYDKMLQSIKPEDYTAYFEAAENYNQELSRLDFPLLDFEQVEGYNDILNLNGTGMMGYLTIEKIGVELPVYHGTEEGVLAVAVGHLQGTSFPVGGDKNHAVVSAHRGLPSATLFTQLDHLEVGDTFTFTILDRTITYMVDNIVVVLPEDTTYLAMEEGKDYCTLLTCTPLAINTHRLLVRGVRMDTVQQKTIHITSDAFQIDALIVTPVVALPIILVLMIVVLCKPVKKEDLDDD